MLLEHEELAWVAAGIRRVEFEAEQRDVRLDPAEEDRLVFRRAGLASAVAIRLRLRGVNDDVGVAADQLAAHEQHERIVGVRLIVPQRGRPSMDRADVRVDLPSVRLPISQKWRK